MVWPPPQGRDASGVRRVTILITTTTTTTMTIIIMTLIITTVSPSHTPPPRVHSYVTSGSVLNKNDGEKLSNGVVLGSVIWCAIALHLTIYDLRKTILTYQRDVDKLFDQLKSIAGYAAMTGEAPPGSPSGSPSQGGGGGGSTRLDLAKVEQFIMQSRKVLVKYGSLRPASTASQNNSGSLHASVKSGGRSNRASAWMSTSFKRSFSNASKVFVADESADSSNHRSISSSSSGRGLNESMKGSLNARDGASVLAAAESKERDIEANVVVADSTRNPMSSALLGADEKPMSS
jgi:hypothetical protein